MRTVFTLRAINLDQLAVGSLKLVLTGITHDTEIRADRDQTFSLCFGWLESLEVLINGDGWQIARHLQKAQQELSDISYRIAIQRTCHGG